MIVKDLFIEGGIKRTYQALERMNKDDKVQRAIYESRIKMLRDIDTEQVAQKAAGLAEGRLEGKIEGKAEIIKNSIKVA